MFSIIRFIYMKKIQLLLLLIFIANNAFSQLNNSVWCFGDSARIDFFGASVTAFSSTVISRGSCVSIADTGGLIYYAFTRATVTGNTTLVKTFNDSIMSNGVNIVGQGWYHELVALPDPASQNNFYLFSNGITNSGLSGIHYSKIDIIQNNGLGQVVQKNVPLFISLMTDVMAAVKHGNGRDWWVIAKHRFNLYNSDTLLQYLVTPAGVLGPYKLNTTVANGPGFANFTFSSDGSKLLYTAITGLIMTLDFDRCNGQISNPIIIKPEVGSGGSNWTWGSCFSPNDSLIYVSHIDVPSKIIQYNLYAPNIAASADTFALIMPSSPAFARNAGALKLGPDGKIYVACAWSDTLGSFNYPYPDTAYHPDNMYLATIDSPNVIGAGCHFNPYGFYLGGKRSYWGLPNNPDYEMGALMGSPCDTLTGLTPNPSPQERGTLEVFPNPANNTITVVIEKTVLLNAKITITDAPGKIIQEQEVMQNQTQINITSLHAGIYFIHLLTKEKSYSAKFVKQ